MPSKLAPLSPRRSRDRDQGSNYNDSASEPYDPNSAMSVFSAWGSMFSDEVGARDESNWFRDQRGQSVLGGNDPPSGNETRSSADAAEGHTTAPDFFSDLASMLFPVIGPEGNWYYDQHVYSQLGRSTEDSDASYVSARSSLDSTMSDVPSLSEAESEVESPTQGSNAGSAPSTSISSLHALSEASFASGESGEARGPTNSTVADDDGGLGSDEARRAAKGKAVATDAASAADSEWIEASKIVFSDGDGGRLPPGYYVYMLKTDSRASGMPPQRPAPRASGMPPQRPAPRASGMPPQRPAPRASGMPPQRPAPPLPRRR